jgi:hypothetical protein
MQSLLKTLQVRFVLVSTHAPTSECCCALETTLVPGLPYLIGKLDEPLKFKLTAPPIQPVACGVPPDLPVSAGLPQAGTCLFLFVFPAELT